MIGVAQKGWIPHAIRYRHEGRTGSMTAEGLDELGLCGIGTAVANAIDNATSVRMRRHPVPSTG